MNDNFYITTDGELHRQDNTIYFENDQTKRALPVERIRSMVATSSLSLSSGVILFLGKKGIPVHFFDYYGWYKSTLYPRETRVSGDVTVRQSEHHLDSTRREYLAQQFVEGGINNIVKNLEYYNRRDEKLDSFLESINDERTKLTETNKLSEIMSVEGSVRSIYYDAMDTLVPESYQMENRVRQPPNNRMNALVSFGNSLVYTTVLTELYHTPLDPTVSFLHEPRERRFSLSLDVAEIFKPILADRIILKLIRKNMLSDSSFDQDVGETLLSDSGRKTFLEQYDEKLETTIDHPGLDTRVSYRRLIRIELYKIVKHLMGEKQYDPLEMWW